MIPCFLQIHLSKLNPYCIVVGISLFVNTNKIEFMCFKQEGAISTLSSKTLKLVDKFTYHNSNISSIKCDANVHLAKVWTAINWLLIIWKSDILNKIKWDFFHAVAVLTTVKEWQC